jgi:hypothetical protein
MFHTRKSGTDGSSARGCLRRIDQGHPTPRASTPKLRLPLLNQSHDPLSDGARSCRTVAPCDTHAPRRTPPRKRAPHRKKQIHTCRPDAGSLVCGGARIIVRRYVAPSAQTKHKLPSQPFRTGYGARYLSKAARLWREQTAVAGSGGIEWFRAGSGREARTASAHRTVSFHRRCPLEKPRGEI